jgi:aspartyl/asparaginyl beta-hydroxylase (cupin superfamily)
VSNLNLHKLWFSLFTNADYVSDEKSFIDAGEITGVKDLEKNYGVILKELETYLSAHQMQGHFNVTMVDKPQSWKVRSLRVWDVEMYEIQKHFTKTMTLLNAIPGVVGISFNLLEAQAKIKPHCGDTNAILRCHLGLKVPVAAPDCALKVKEEIRGWENGKVLAFNDAYQHEAWNLSNENRIVLLFDILKPGFAKKRSKICGTVLSSLYLQRLGNRWPALYKMKRERTRLILQPFIWFLRMAIPLRNSLKKSN